MEAEVKERPLITRSDLKLRLFIDTNVLIDFIEHFDEKKSKTFIELFKNKNFNNIELVTSDYVLWEFYGHFRDELYVKKLIENLKYGYINAVQECRRRSYSKASMEDMEGIGETIKGYLKQFAENPVSIQKLVGKRMDGFSELVEKILQCSRFSYSDTIVFVSALLTNSHIIITHDETFASENHLTELKESLKSLPLTRDVEFRKAKDFSTEGSVKKNYKNWFLQHNKSKQIGKVIKVWPKKNTIAVECLNNYFIRQDDYLCIVKFLKGMDFTMIIDRVKKDNLRDYETSEVISKGKKVTIKLASDKKCDPHTKGALVFVYSE
jgi:hypothetical protein